MERKRRYLAVVAVQVERVSGEQILAVIDIFEGEIGSGHASLASLPAAFPGDGENATDVQNVVVIFRRRGKYAHTDMEYCCAKP